MSNTIGQASLRRKLGAYAKEQLGLPLAFADRPTFKEFAVRLEAAGARRDPRGPRSRRPSGLRDRTRLRRHGRRAAVAVTENAAPPTSTGWRRSCTRCEPDGAALREVEAGPPRGDAAELRPARGRGAGRLRRAEPPRLPELAEPELVRHFTELSTRNFGIDTGFYPLGNSWMRYHPTSSGDSGIWEISPYGLSL